MATEQQDKLTKTVASESIGNIMQYRGHITILKNQFRTQAFKTDPTNTTIYENSTVAKLDINTAKRSVTGVNYIAQKAEKAGKSEAQGILDKFSQSYYGEQIVSDIQSGNPVKSFADYDKFEAAKPNSVVQAQAIAQSEDEQAQINARIGTEEPAAGSEAFGYADNFKNKDAVMNLLKTCIPCEFRSIKFSAEFGLPWANTLDDLKKKWKDLLKLLKDLLSFQSGDFGKDLCNLFKFLDGQCIPDILGLLSLLSMMQLKYTDMSLTGLSNILNQLIAPFLSPIIGSFTSNLDQYADIILGPLKCVVRALEFQITNIQTQVNGALDIASKNTVAYRQKEIDFIERKAKLLRNRQRVIDTELKNPANNSDTQSGATRQVRAAQTNLTASGSVTVIDGNNTTQITLQQEKQNIKNELDKLQIQKNKIQSQMKEASPLANPINLSGATTLTSQTTFALNNMERAYRSVLQDLVDAINDGFGVIKQSIDIYRDEFQRLLLGRINTQADQVEFTRMIQQFMRLTSVVKAVYDFKQAGFNLKKLCEMGEENALAQIAKQIKSNDSTGMYDFYKATDSEGNSLMVITPGGSKVTLTGIDFDSLGDDALIGDSSLDLDSLKTTVSFNDLNEVDKLNREGIVPDLGNIDSKLIEVSSTSAGLDLQFKTSYAIISNEFCSKSAISYGSSDTVKKWAETLWQEK